MKCAFLIHGTLGISGGTNVIIEHAARMHKRGNQIYILSPEAIDSKNLDWHPDGKVITRMTINEAKSEFFDIVFATWWVTVYDLHQINSKVYAYFNQSVESRFYPEEEKKLKMLADMTYLQNLQIITEATWIKDYLKNNYNVNALLVKNGIRKDIYNNDVIPYTKRDESKLRVLVEGSIDVPFKNVERTIQLCMQSNADEIWLLTSSDINEHANVDKIYSQILIQNTSKVYASCDVIVKLSYVEGMFGPPLEMFHCGGTAIVYNVSGHDEYIIHDYNAIVIEKFNEEKVIESINYLKENKTKLNQLKEGAKNTADTWHDWDQASIAYETASKQLIEQYDDNLLTKHRLYSFHEIFKYVMASNESTGFLFFLRQYLFPQGSKRHKIAKKLYRSIL